MADAIDAAKEDMRKINRVTVLGTDNGDAQREEANIDNGDGAVFLDFDFARQPGDDQRRDDPRAQAANKRDWWRHSRRLSVYEMATPGRIECAKASPKNDIPRTTTKQPTTALMPPTRTSASMPRWMKA